METNFEKAKSMLLRSTNPMNVLEMLSDLTGNGKFNMVASKPGVPISKIVDKIGTKVQRLYICFLGQATQW